MILYITSRFASHFVLLGIELGAILFARQKIREGF